MAELIEKVIRVMLCNARQCWEQGIAAMAMEELGEAELLISMCHDIVIRQNEDGRLCDVESTPAATDSSICIRPVLTAGRLTGDPRFEEAVRRNIQYLRESAPRNGNGVLYHLQDAQEVWADSAAMTPANLVRAGMRSFGIQQMDGILDLLRLPETGLFAHKWDDGQGTYLRKEAWAAGNGWIAVGLAWLIIALGKDDLEVARMLSTYQGHVENMLRYRAASGLFHNILDDPESFEDCESAAMLAYSNALLAEAGYLDREALMEAERTLEILSTHADARGYIRDCPGSPDFLSPGTSTEMQAFFLMLYAVLQRCGGRGKETHASRTETHGVAGCF